MLVRQWECKTNSWIIMLDLGEHTFVLFGDLSRISRWTGLEGLRGSRRAGQSSRTASSEHKNGPLQCAESRSNAAERQHGWTGLKCKKEVHRRRKQWQATWDEYGDTSWVYRDGAAKVKAYLELKLARDVKIQKKGFFLHTLTAKKNLGPSA